MFHGHSDYFQKPPLGGRPNTKPGNHGTPNAHNRRIILFYHVWGSAWIEIHRNSIWLRARSHMASHYTWGSVTTLLNLEGVLRRPLDSFSWALPISWSRLLAHVWSGLECSLFYHVWGPARVEIPWTNIWLKAQSHIASHYTWGSVTTLLNLEGVLGWHLDTFSWALTIP